MAGGTSPRGNPPGTCTPGAAVVTFADATGNYRKISSGTVTVTVT